MQELKLRKLWLTIGWLLIAMVWYLSLTSAPMPDMGMDNSDKLGHFLAYGLLMGWFAQIYHKIKPRILLVFAFIAMGIAIEFVQGMTDYRSFQYGDMVADSMGVLLAFTISHGYFKKILFHLEQHFLT
ncbi:MAG: VanZ family protein [Gammaproteobacteria bacterium]|nr:VanZ family protein [Gammaproteobacteria bacterium]